MRIAWNLKSLSFLMIIDNMAHEGAKRLLKYLEKVRGRREQIRRGERPPYVDTFEELRKRGEDGYSVIEKIAPRPILLIKVPFP